MFKAFEFCLPTNAAKVPAGPEWLHEIKQDGLRIRVERDGYCSYVCRKVVMLKAHSLRVRGVFSMPTQIVMNHNGDTRYYFDARNAAALAKAEERFKQLTGEGFTAAVRTKPGEVTIISSFNPKAEETVFFPRLVGG
jgi:hypothetical protein